MPPVAETPIESTLKELIRSEGPITISRFMQLALYHPDHGYYMQVNPFGEEGDFITAPEVSQMFGEVLGLWVADLWMRAGAPERLRLVELGAGNGTLMADILRATAHVPGLHTALEVILIEISPRLRERQRQMLAPYVVKLDWKHNIGQIDEGPFTFVIGNEFLDALPIHQCVRTEGGWVEKGVGLDDAGNLAFVVTNQPLPVSPGRWMQNDSPGALRELCPGAADTMKQVGRLLSGQGGACLFIDYGYADAPSNPGTLQALKSHQYHPVLEEVGTADLTAHVDFLALKEVALAAKLIPLPLATQGNFLTRLGIQTRLKTLLARATPAQKKMLEAQLDRLILPAEMGTLFKVFCATSANVPVPLGFYEN